MAFLKTIYQFHYLCSKIKRHYLNYGMFYTSAYEQYGNTDCGVLKQGTFKNLERFFCKKINCSKTKLLNFDNWTNWTKLHNRCFHNEQTCYESQPPNLYYKQKKKVQPIQMIVYKALQYVGPINPELQYYFMTYYIPVQYNATTLLLQLVITCSQPACQHSLAY